MYIWAPCACLVPMNDSRWNQIFWKWSYTWLWATVWVLRIKPGSAVRTESTLKFWTTSPVPAVLVLCWTLVFFSFKIIFLILENLWFYFIYVCLCVSHVVIAFSNFFSVTLNKNCQSRLHILIQDLSGKVFHFIPSYIVILETDLFYMQSSSCWSIIILHTNFSKIFIIKQFHIFQVFFYISCNYIIYLCFLYDAICYIYWFLHFDPSWHPYHKTNWIACPWCLIC